MFNVYRSGKNAVSSVLKSIAIEFRKWFEVNWLEDHSYQSNWVKKTKRRNKSGILMFYGFLTALFCMFLYIVFYRLKFKFMFFFALENPSFSYEDEKCLCCFGERVFVFRIYLQLRFVAICLGFPDGLRIKFKDIVCYTVYLRRLNVIRWIISVYHLHSNAYDIIFQASRVWQKSCSLFSEAVCRT